MLNIKKSLFLPAVVSFCLIMLQAQPVRAQCEDSSSASDEMNTLVQDDIDNLNDFINQEWNFIDEDLTNTATNEVTTRMDDFDDNVTAALNDWWENGYLPAMKDMTKQWSGIQVDQSLQLGNALNSQTMGESMLTLSSSEADAHSRLRPSETTCQTDSIGTGAVKAQRLARAVARGYANSSLPARENKVGTPAAGGIAGQNRALWDEYVTEFCDPAKGDQGCTTAGTFAGKNTNLPALLFGEKQTIDMSNTDNAKINEVAMRTLISPEVADPVPRNAVNTAAGREELIKRRSRNARMNAIYHAVGTLLGERSSGSGKDTSTMRQAAGIAPGNASADASYKEISDTLGRSRFLNPQYVTRIVDDPAQVVREMGAVKAVQLQNMSNMYKRTEEMLLLEATDYASKLDVVNPDNGTANTKVK